MNLIVPKGWTRAAAIQVNTAPSPYLIDPRYVAVVQPYHATPPGSETTLKFATVAAYEEWRKWWFDAPLPDPNPSFTQQVWATPEPTKPPLNPFAVPPAVEKKPLSPFDQPKPTTPPNPFDKPKPFNPFEKR